MESITARSQWTFDDMTVGRRLVKKPNNLGLPLIICVAVICCGIILVGAPGCRTYPLRTNLIILGIFSVATTIGAVALYLARKVGTSFSRSEFSDRPDADYEIEWNFSADEIRISTENSKSELKWAAFYKVLSSPEGFLFMPNAEIFHFVPTRAFQSPEDILSLICLARQQASDFKELK